MTLRNSLIDPGQPWVITRGSASACGDRRAPRLGCRRGMALSHRSLLSPPCSMKSSTSSTTIAGAVRTYGRRSPVTERSAGFGFLVPLLEVDAELAQFDDRRSAPADRVRRERQRERHPVRFAERLALAQDAVVPRRRLDREAERLEAADELANVLPHLGPGSPGRGSACQLRVRSPVVQTTRHPSCGRAVHQSFPWRRRSWRVMDSTATAGRALTSGHFV